MTATVKRRSPTAFSLAVAAIGLSVLASPLVASAAPPATAGDNTTNLAPLIKHTNKPPTGYTVTFRFRDPAATRVQIKGEWYFERPSDLPAPRQPAWRPRADAGPTAHRVAAG